MTVINRTRITDNLTDIIIECDVCSMFHRDQTSKFAFSMMLDNPAVAIMTLKEEGWLTRVVNEDKIEVIHICPDCSKKLDELSKALKGESDEPEEEDSAASGD